MDRLALGELSGGAQMMLSHALQESARAPSLVLQESAHAMGPALLERVPAPILVAWHAYELGVLHRQSLASRVAESQKPAGSWAGSTPSIPG